ncbi:MAG: PKD domain-containing protein, partial [Thermoleophilia bacterium]
VLAVPASAFAADPSVPHLDPVPRVVGPGSALGWSAATFSPAHTSQGYHVVIAAPGVPMIVADPLGPLATTLPLPALVDGTTYQATVTATALENASPVSSPTSPPASFLFDSRPPTGTVAIDDGAEYATGLTVTLHFRASDPLPGAGEVGAMDVAEGDFPCGDPIACHRSYVTGVQKYLAAGPDGVRKISARFYDTAVRTAKGTGGVDGNVSEIVSDTIFLDRRAPTARFAASPAPAAGRMVTFTAAGSADGEDGPRDSGLSGRVEWDFGDGTTATGVTVRHALPAGRPTVTVTVYDRAGLSGTASTQFTVAAPAGATAAVRGLRALGTPRAGAPMRVRLTLARRGPLTLRLLDAGAGRSAPCGAPPVRAR